MAETAPNTARNWRKERFRKYTAPLPYAAKPEPDESMSSTQRRRERRGRRREDQRQRSFFACCYLCVLCVSALNAISALNGPFRFSRNPSHADQVSEDDAFQGLRGGDPGIAAAAAHRHGLQPGAIFVEGAGVAPARVIVEIQFHAGPGLGVAQ